ncbi:MAG TPA: MerR family transcriptional regulator [Candidatus Acidoferrum sp.]|nr:MerR family transcriptional regulator [Candidatus Acidoferrum sp.]
MPKPEGLFPIGEIAATCGLSVNALRFYESKQLARPAYTDPESGYRYYSREDLLRLRAILGLKGAGLSLPEIKEYLDGNMDRNTKIAALEERRDMLSLAIEDLKIRNTAPGDLTVCELRLPERLCLCRTITAKDGEGALRAIGGFYDELIRKGTPISCKWPEFCEYPDEGLLRGEFPVTDFTVTACLPVDKNNAPPHAVRYPAGDAVAVNYRGSYYELWRAYEAIGLYIAAHGYAPAGYPQEIYLETQSDGSVLLDGAYNITRVIVPIKRGE